MKHRRTPFALLALLNFGAAQAAPAPAPSTYGALGGQWWLWALTAPSDRNPVNDLTGKHCDVNQTHPVFFLAQSPRNGTLVRRTCTVPADKPLFFPLYTQSVVRETKAGCEDRMQTLKLDMDAVTDLQLSVDAQAPSAGMPLNGTRGTMACTYLPDLGVWLGTDGYWASVTFDQPGKHTVAWSGVTGRFRQNVRYTLTVR
jgi:hypothetical protein